MSDGGRRVAGWGSWGMVSLLGAIESRSGYGSWMARRKQIPYGWRPSGMTNLRRNESKFARRLFTFRHDSLRFQTVRIVCSCGGRVEGRDPSTVVVLCALRKEQSSLRMTILVWKNSMEDDKLNLEWESYAGLTNLAGSACADGNFILWCRPGLGYFPGIPRSSMWRSMSAGSE
jgi:hypothetical protein